MKYINWITIGLLLVFNIVTAQATLIDRGGGLLYDNVLNVTWLQDANYAKTSGYDADGLMDWTNANTWATDLYYGGISDWRLARNTPVNSSTYNYDFSFNGSTDYGYNITSPNSELAYMYYVNLGLKGYYSPAADYQSDFGVFGNGTFNGVDQSSLGQNNVGLVNNLQSYGYWASTEYAPLPGYALFFYTYVGVQGMSANDIQFYAWAVRDGDVFTVPEPAAICLFASALGLLLFTRKKQNN